MTCMKADRQDRQVKRLFEVTFKQFWKKVVVWGEGVHADSDTEVRGAIRAHGHAPNECITSSSHQPTTFFAQPLLCHQLIVEELWWLHLVIVKIESKITVTCVI